MKPSQNKAKTKLNTKEQRTNKARRKANNK